MTNHTEQRIQQECYIYFHNTYPHLRGLFFRIKNEGTSKISGAIGKATGIVPGVSDMCMLISGRVVFVEFKTPEGKQSQHQKNWQQLIKQAGFQYELIHSLDEFKELCQKLHL
jgi:hypothetical protein